MIINHSQPLIQTHQQSNKIKVHNKLINNKT